MTFDNHFCSEHENKACIQDDNLGEEEGDFWSQVPAVSVEDVVVTTTAISKAGPVKKRKQKSRRCEGSYMSEESGSEDGEGVKVQQSNERLSLTVNSRRSSSVLKELEQDWSGQEKVVKRRKTTVTSGDSIVSKQGQVSQFYSQQQINQSEEETLSSALLLVGCEEREGSEESSQEIDVDMVSENSRMEISSDSDKSEESIDLGVPQLKVPGLLEIVLQGMQRNRSTTPQVDKVRLMEEHNEGSMMGEQVQEPIMGEHEEDTLAEEQGSSGQAVVPLFSEEVELFHAFFWANWRLVAKELNTSDRKKIYAGVENLYDSTVAAVKEKDSFNDATPPKKPPTSFLLFSKKMYSAIAKKVKEDKRVKGKDVQKETSKELSKMWKSLSEHEKEPYAREAEKLRNDHEKAVRNFYSTDPVINDI